MQPRPRGIAARIGGWSVRHKKTAVFGWLAFVALAVVIGGVVGKKTLSDTASGVGDSGTAAKIVDQAGFSSKASEQVLLHSATLRPSDPAFKAAIDDVARRVTSTGRVKHLQVPGTPGAANLVSKDGHSALVQFDLKGDPETAADRIAPVEKAVAAAQAAHRSLRIEEFGGASAGKAIGDAISKDFQTAERLSLPLTLIILFLAFGALMAAGVPVLLALSAVFATFGLVAIPSHIFPVSQNLEVLIMLIGMAVGVDYSLFYLKREREERLAGRSHQEALEIAAATSGRAILISGLTVMVASAGLFLTGVADDRSSAIGMIVVVAVAMVASLTILPALLAMLGNKVERGRLPFIGRRPRRAESRVWGYVIDHALRRPLLTGGLAAALLVALAVPALHMTARNSGAADLPRNLPVMQTYDRLQAAFPGSAIPADVVIQARDVTSPQVTQGIQQLRARALATGKLQEPVDVQVNPRHTVAVVSLSLLGDGSDAPSFAAVKALRNDVVPATIGQVAGARAYVSGDTATNQDWNDLMTAKTPLVFAFVLGLAFLLLLVTFRSLVIPIKAIVLNLLSVGAAYGVLVTVFQDGHGARLIGGFKTGYVPSWIPLFLFVILFGLSMDYHVFILSRVREAVDRGMRTDEAVAHGIKTTAGVVTSAAVVMVAVFSIFATLSLVDFKEIGVGLAAAILIDATIIRGVLLPASMKLLGDWNWYLPRWLEWLPRVSHEGDVAPTPGRHERHGAALPAPGAA